MVRFFTKNRYGIVVENWNVLFALVLIFSYSEKRSTIPKLCFRLEWFFIHTTQVPWMHYHKQIKSGMYWMSNSGTEGCCKFSLCHLPTNKRYVLQKFFRGLDTAHHEVSSADAISPKTSKTFQILLFIRNSRHQGIEKIFLMDFIVTESKIIQPWRQTGHSPSFWSSRKSYQRNEELRRQTSNI